MGIQRHRALLDPQSPAWRVENVEAFEPCWLETYQYALLNPLSVVQADLAGLPCQPLKTRSIKVREHLLPQLLCLNALSAAQRESLTAIVAEYTRRGTPFLSALLQSEATPDQIISHFRFTLEQPRSGSKRRWWLRCYDPRVFRHLCWLLDELRMDRLLGPITAWSWPDLSGCWHRLPRGGELDPWKRMPMLSRQQWAAIDRMALLNGTLDRLAMLAPEIRCSFEDYVWLDGLLAEAHERGLSDAEDCRLYAEQGARFHPHIHDHPGLRQRLNETIEQHGSYARYCEDLSPQLLQTMARELEKTT